METREAQKPSPTILIVDPDVASRDSLAKTLIHAGYNAMTVGDAEAARIKLESVPLQLILCEREFHESGESSLLPTLRTLSTPVPVLVMSGQQSVTTVVDAVKNGAADFIAKPVKSEVLLRLVEEYLPVTIGGDTLVAVDHVSQQVSDLALRVSQTDATVLICGPSGVGKEVYSRFIHRHSRRTHHPFVAVNCAAIPENMLEAMLFGYEKGAYTGAVNNHIGKFEQAQGGTLLLDEITEMDLSLQAKLLRVLQEREIERLGGRRTIRLDVRVIATTNRDLREAVRKGDFREDLFYRLSVFPLHIPSLAERPNDIIPLAEHFLRTNRHSHAANPDCQLSVDAVRKLQSHNWPGNVRELDNVIQRALILQSDREIGAGDIQFELVATTQETPTNVALDSSSEEQGLTAWMREQEHQQIQNAIRVGGSKKEAAAILGISPRTLRYKLARLREEQFAS